MPSDFHFLSPQWFLALIPLAAILWGLGRRRTGAGAWQRVVDPNLLPHLLMPGGGKEHRLPLVLLATGWLIALIALANPTFERLPVPVYRGELARIVTLDLSHSMEAADLEPSRLARARYKVADILARSRDGQVGLIAFAGDAFVVSPLTEDADTILSLLDALAPEIMPVQGSRPDLALVKAAELLTQAGATQGEVVLIGDDAGGSGALAEAKALNAAGHSLSVIGVGTAKGAPLPGLIRADEEPVTVRLDTESMRALAQAGGGTYAPLSADGRDLDRVLRTATIMPDQVLDEPQMQTEVWKELGPWILLAALPLGALAFRRGWLLAIALTIGNGALVPDPALASGWDDLWQRRDQQAAAALERGEHRQVLDLAEQPQQRGTASYRLGDYEAAAEAFATLDQSDSHYNRGNALAKSGRLEEAVAAYEQALAQAPGMEDAAHNKTLVEELLRQQQEQQSQKDGESKQQGEQPKQQQPEGQKDTDPAQESKGPQQASGQDQKSAEGNQAGGQERDQQSEPAQDPDTGTATDSPDSQPSDETDPDPDQSSDSEETEQAAADYREQAAEQEEGQGSDTSGPAQEAPSIQEREERQATDQWLRRIPDDPAGLLRRKFRYQYRSRAVQEGAAISGNPW